MAKLDLFEIFFASAIVSVSSNSIGTALLMSPYITACSDDIKSPVNSICIACFLWILRDNATAGVEQKSPTLIPVTPKVASLAATAISQAATVQCVYEKEVE